MRFIRSGIRDGLEGIVMLLVREVVRVRVFVS